MKKKVYAAVLIISAILTGCGKENVDATETIVDPLAYLNEMEDGVYYVRHYDNTIEPIYFGNATFDMEDIPHQATNDRIMWFKEDFVNIPTLYAGESIILQTANEFEETVNFERFEDLGYTIGICNMQVKESGRLSISTEKDDRCTYPNSDADKIINLSNENVILDTIAGKEIRVLDKKSTQDDEIVPGTWKDSLLSRCGTINNLAKGSTYKVEIYNGTFRNEYLLTADVRVLSSLEMWTSYDYVFESERIINVKIPEYFNSGYYLLNGLGMFRYVKEVDSNDESGQKLMKSLDFSEFGDSASYRAIVTFDTLNVDPEAEKEDEKEQINNPSTIPGLEYDKLNVPGGNQSAGTVTYINEDGYEEVLSKEIVDGYSSSNLFAVNRVGKTTISVTYKMDEYTDGLPEVTAIITTPSGSTNYQMGYDEDSDMSTLTFNVEETGNYKITYYNLEGRVPYVNVLAR